MTRDLRLVHSDTSREHYGFVSVRGNRYDLRIVSTSSAFLQSCMLYTAVVPIEKLEKCHPNGLRFFAEKHTVHFSRDLAGACAMHHDDIDGFLRDLYDCGLRPRTDYVVLEGFSDFANADVGEITRLWVDWLEVLVTDEGPYVRLVKKTGYWNRTRRDDIG